MQNNFPALPVKAVFFDLDDTLSDHRYSMRQGLLAVCQAYPCFQQHSIELLFADYTRLFDEMHIHVLEGRLTKDERRNECFRRLFLLHGPETEDLPNAVACAAHLYRETYQSSRQIVAGSLELLEYLNGRVKIAVVTNNLQAGQVDKLHHLRLDHLIDELVTSEETGSIKPDPDIFRAALEHVGCSADEAVMIGDSWESDVLGAIQAGIRAIWLNRTGSACPDPMLALELAGLEPLEVALNAILGQRDDQGIQTGEMCR
jgi:putative hydrolase of the HAD superfamily